MADELESPGAEESLGPGEEGFFDAQLTFPTLTGEAAAPIPFVTKRDGTTAPFDKGRIARAIERAAESAGLGETVQAASLASAVTLYLRKRQSGDTLATGTVNQAVEKVLLDMGHAPIALAYARYRDRRQRLRRYHPERVARREDDASAALDGTTDGFERLPRVWRSDETSAGWDRARIAEALERETDMPADQARDVALEVEEQIRMLGIERVTTSLIRELTDASLSRRGLEEERARHARLGVPLYDAGRIIRQPGAYYDADAFTPEATGRLLAECVKREFAFTSVFSGAVREAHITGSIHLHNPGMIDQLETTTFSPGWIARFGAPRLGGGSNAPPQFPEALMVQSARAHALLSAYFTAGLAWEAVNLHAAPLLEAADAMSMRRAAQWLLQEFGPPTQPLAEIQLVWDAPVQWAHAKVPRAEGASAAVYGDFEPELRRLAKAVLAETYRGDMGAPGRSGPICTLQLPVDWSARDDVAAWVETATEAVLQDAPIVFELDRGVGQMELGASLWQPRALKAHQVTLNLPRAAYRAGGNPDLLWGELDRMIETAVAAHLQKRDFLADLWKQGALGPLALLTRKYGGVPLCALREARYAIGVTGLDECVRYVTGSGLATSEAASGLAASILGYLSDECAGWASQKELFLDLVPDWHPGSARRLALCDAREHPESTASVAERGEMGHEWSYTPGCAIPEHAELDLASRLRVEGAFHAYFEPSRDTEIRLPITEAATPRELRSLLTLAHESTPVHRLCFVPDTPDW